MLRFESLNWPSLHQRRRNRLQRIANPQTDRKLQVERLEDRRLLAVDPASWILPVDESVGRLAVTENGDIYRAYNSACCQGTERDILLSKYSSTGDEWLLRHFQSPGDAILDDVALDQNNAIYIKGSFTDQIDFGLDAEGNHVELQSNGEWDAFVVKLDASGTPLWAKSYGGRESELWGGVAVQGQNVYVNGGFQSSVSFGGTTLRAKGGDSYVLKLDASTGEVVWVEQIGGRGNATSEMIATQPTSTGGVNVYVTGRLSGKVTFGNIAMNGDSNRLYLAKLSDEASGRSVDWAEQFGGENGEGGFLAIDDVSGRIFVTGGFDDDATEGRDGFVMGVTDNGAAASIDWVNQIHGSMTQYSRAIAIDAGVLFVAGYFEYDTTFDSVVTPEVAVNSTLSSRGLEDGFLARYDVDGKLLAVQRLGGSDVDTMSHTIVAHSDPILPQGPPIIYAFGGTGPTDTDIPTQVPADTTPNAFLGEGMKFLLKLNSAAPIVQTANSVTSSDDTSVVLSASAFVLEPSQKRDLTSNDIVWTHADGTYLGSGESIDMSDLPIGTHQITVSAIDPVTGLSGMAGTVLEITDSAAVVVDDFAVAETTLIGQLKYDSSLADTQADDNVYEVMREDYKPKRYSRLDHRWTFDVTGGGTVTFHVEAWHTVNSEGDEFLFAYSTDDIDYTSMLTVTKTSDDNMAQSFELPEGVSGTVYVRVTDTDRTKGNNSWEYLYVDLMFIRSESSVGAVSSILTKSNLPSMSQSSGLLDDNSVNTEVAPSLIKPEGGNVDERAWYQPVIDASNRIGGDMDDAEAVDPSALMELLELELDDVLLRDLATRLVR